MANKFALLVGINYIGTPNELSGCINDVIMVRKYLIEKRGYLDSNIVMMREDSNKFMKPNRVNMIAQITELINKANKNNASEIFFHYSGHGTYITDRNRDEIDGRDEMICPIDLNCITDDELRTIVGQLNKNTVLYSIMDCCHSGTIIDLPFVYNYVNKKFALIQNNAFRYPQLLNKNIFAISGCRDEQYSSDVYQIYSPLNGTPEYSITQNRAGGALTFFILDLLNKNYPFLDCLLLLQQNLAKNGFDQVPLLSSTKLITKREITNNNPKIKTIINVGVNKGDKSINKTKLQKSNRNNKMLMVPVRNH
jgi:hypothetical protein